MNRFALIAACALALLAACGDDGDDVPDVGTPRPGQTVAPTACVPAPAELPPATPPESDGNAAGIPPLQGQIQTNPSGLKYIDELVGTGAAVEACKTVVVHYTGWLTDGTKFDSSRDRGTPYIFTLGIRRVIAGWDEGVATMRVGGKRRLIVPSEMAYRDRGQGPIPPNADLIFDVEVLEVR